MILFGLSKTLFCHMWIGIPRKTMDCNDIRCTCTNSQYAQEGCYRSSRMLRSKFAKTGKSDIHIGRKRFTYEYCPQHFMWGKRNPRSSRHVEQTSTVSLIFLYKTKPRWCNESNFPHTLWLVTGTEVQHITKCN